MMLIAFTVVVISIDIRIVIPSIAFYIMLMITTSSIFVTSVLFIEQPLWNSLSSYLLAAVIILFLLLAGLVVVGVLIYTRRFKCSRNKHPVIKNIPFVWFDNFVRILGISFH